MSSCIWGKHKILLTTRSFSFDFTVKGTYFLNYVIEIQDVFKGKSTSATTLKGENNREPGSGEVRESASVPASKSRSINNNWRVSWV